MFKETLARTISSAALFVFLLSAPAQAYSVFTLKPVSWNKVKSVDIFIAGYGEELGLQFLYSAVTRAQKHDEVYSDERAQVIIWAKEWSERKDRNAITRRGFSILRTDRGILSNSDVVKELNSFSAISSLHFFSHNAAFGGAALQKSQRLGKDSINWEGLKAKFTADAYIFLHGCNTGFIVAPGISKKVQLPVMGSMTSTDFQEIYDNGNFYHNNSGWGQYPEGLSKKKTSSNLFAEEFPCWRGFCHRMMPNEHTYRGDFGYYKVGLPYYQAFCNFKDNKGAKCGAGVAHAIKGAAGLLGENWEDKVVDYMCPRMADPKVFETCVASLKGQSEESVFRGKILKCSREKCHAEIKGGGGGLFRRKPRYFDGQDAGVEQFRNDFNFFMSLESYIK